MTADLHVPVTLNCTKCGGIYGADESHVCPDDTAARQKLEPKRVLIPNREAMIAAMINNVMQLWPITSEATGCINCKAIFRTPENGRCPHCQSESCFDVAAIINRERQEVTSGE